MSGPLAKSGYYGFTNMTGDVVLALPHDSSFQLNAKVSDKHDIVSDFKLTYLNETPTPPPAVKPRSPENTPKPPAAKGQPAPKGQPLPKAGPIVAPVVIERQNMPVPYVLRRVNAVCGSGDATISVASFGGTVRIKKI
jgi:hypothetical protein